MTRPLVLLLASCLATSAAAQQLTATLSLGAVSSYTVGPADCGAKVALNWKVTAAPCDNVLNLWVTSGSCGETPGASDLRIFDGDTISTTSGTEYIDVSQLPGATDAGAVCGSATNATYKVCGAFEAWSSLGITCDQTVKMSSPPTLLYDGVAPDAPSLDSLTGVDNGLVAAVTPAADTSQIRLEYKLETEPDTAYREALVFSATSNKATITGLENGTAYSVRAYGIDEAKNVSPASGVLSGAPVNSQGFFGFYVANNGSETGGCSTAGGVAILPAALVALWSLIRRRRS